MKILFLDIDGVLNSDRWFTEQQDGTFMPHEDKMDPKAVAVLNEIIEKSGAKIVISSSWRKFFDFDELKRILCEVNGVKAEIFSTTPVRFSFVSRGYEIREWLQNYYEDLREGEITEPVEAIVSLDDDSSVGDALDIAPYWVQTHWDEGLLPEHAAQALQKLAMPFEFKVPALEPEND